MPEVSTKVATIDLKLGWPDLLYQSFYRKSTYGHIIPSSLHPARSFPVSFSIHSCSQGKKKQSWSLQHFSAEKQTNKSESSFKQKSKYQE